MRGTVAASADGDGGDGSEEGGNADAIAGAAAGEADKPSANGDSLDAPVEAADAAGANAEDAALRALQMCRRFPLLAADRPTERTSAVYVSAKTIIYRFCVSIFRAGDASGDPLVSYIDGATTYLKIPNLRPDTIYDVSVRACYEPKSSSAAAAAGTDAASSAVVTASTAPTADGVDANAATPSSAAADTTDAVAAKATTDSGAEAEEGWGAWSPSVRTGTLNLLQIGVKQLGESYLHADWRRSPNTFAEYGVATGRPEEALRYQFLIHDVTDVAIGGEQRGAALAELLTQDALLADRSSVFKNLKPNRRYRLAVRRWYRPAFLDNSAGYAAALAPAAAPQQQQQQDGGEGGPLSSAALSATTSPSSASASIPHQYASVGPNAANASIITVAQLEAAGALAGAWSDPITVATHKSMAVLVTDISESGMLVRWGRDPDAPSSGSRHCVKVPFTVNSFHMHIDEMAANGAPIPLTGGTSTASAADPSSASATLPSSPTNSNTNSGNNNNTNVLRFNQEFQADELSFRARDLKPDTVYRLQVRCSTDKVWGQWSRPVYVVTLPRLKVTVASIGEDYASLSWGRNIRALTAPDGTVALTGDVTSVDKYELEIEGLDHSFELKRRFKASRTEYRVKRLDPSRVFSIVMRSCETVPHNGGSANAAAAAASAASSSPNGGNGNNGGGSSASGAVSVGGSEEWSEWSARVVFATLKPLQLTFGKVAEQFVHVAWGREPQTAAEYSAYDRNVLLGNATDALSYHLCVFPMAAMPAAAIVDKQFSGDVTKYRVEYLAPSTSYIVIARACNGEQQWGLWCEERIATTQRVLATEIVSVGENYVSVKWSRLAPDDEARRLATDPRSSAAAAGRRAPEGYHLCLTSDSETIDRRFGAEECVRTADEARVPMYTVRGLRSDTKYLLSLQACYGADEWGTWSAPVAFLTVSNLAVKVANITESSAEFTWGRAQQDPTLAADPSVLVWRPTVVRYQLLLRKVEEMRAHEMRQREAELLRLGGGGGEEAGGTFGDFDPVEKKGAGEGALLLPAPPTPTTTLGEDGVPIPMKAVTGSASGDAAAAEDEAEGSTTTNAPPGGAAADSAGASLGANTEAGSSFAPTQTVPHAQRALAVAGGASSSSHPHGGGAAPPPPHFFFEQEMDVRLVKYVQTLSRIDRLEINTEYHFQVRALDDFNEWGQWSEAFFDTPPMPPQNLMMRKEGAMILLSWDPPSRAHRYMYCIEQAVGREGQADGPSGLAGGANGRRGSTVAKGGGSGKTSLRGGGNSPRGGPAASAKKDGVAMDWRVVDTVEDTMARVRAFGPIHRVRCRIKCCKLDTPAHLFSRYSAVVTVNSNVGVEPVEGLRVAAVSKSTAVIEWDRIDPSAAIASSAGGGNPSSGSQSTSAAAAAGASNGDGVTAVIAPAPPPPRVAYRVLLAVNNQPLTTVATLKSNTFELTDLRPATMYVVQVITETDVGTCQRNATLRFATRPDGDRGVYKWAPGQPPLGDLTPPPQDRTLLMLNDGNGNGGGGGGALGSTIGSSVGGGGGQGRLPSLLGDVGRFGASGSSTAMTPRPPQQRGGGLGGGGGLQSPLTHHGASTPRGNSASTQSFGGRGSALLGTPATQSRRPPGTAPHGATRSRSGAPQQQQQYGGVNFNNQYPPPAAPLAAGGVRKPAPPSAGGAAAAGGRSPVPPHVSASASHHGYGPSGAGAGVVLPPVGQRPLSGAARAVEHFDYVGFVPSDDEK